MNFEKSFDFKRKVFKEVDIRSIWQFVFKQTKSPLSGHAEIAIKNDDESVSSDDDSIFETANFRLKDIQQIEIKYYSSDYNSHIFILIRTMGTMTISYGNYVEVKGVSEEWVDACATKLHEIISYVSTTSWMWRLCCNICMCIGLIFCAIWIFMFLDYVAPFLRDATIDLYVKYVLALMYFFVGCLCAWKLFVIFVDLPVIVIDINGRHGRSQQNLLRLTWSFVGTILIPVLLWWLTTVLNKQEIQDDQNAKFDKNCVTNEVEKYEDSL